MVCITECTDKPPPVNGSVVDNGTYASFTCDVGFNLIGHSTSVCHEDGSGWSSITPTCSMQALLFCYTIRIPYFIYKSDNCRMSNLLFVDSVTLCKRIFFRVTEQRNVIYVWTCLHLHTNTSVCNCSLFCFISLTNITLFNGGKHCFIAMYIVFNITNNGR